MIKNIYITFWVILMWSFDSVPRKVLRVNVILQHTLENVWVNLGFAIWPLNAQEAHHEFF